MNVALSSAASRQRDVEVVDVVLRQPGRQRHVGAEDGGVVEAEAPHPHVPQRGEHLAHRLAGAGPAVVARHDDEGEGRDHDQGHGVEGGEDPPAAREDAEVGGARGAGDDRREQHDEQLGDRGADVAGAEDAEREALAVLGEPGGVPRDADAEQVAGEPDEEGQGQQGQVARRLGDEEAGDRGEEQHRHGDDATTDPVGEHARRQAPQRAVEHRDGGDPGQLRVGEAELLLDRHAEDAEHQPDREHQGEGDGRHREDPLGPTGDVASTGIRDGGRLLGHRLGQQLGHLGSSIWMKRIL